MKFPIFSKSKLLILALLLITSTIFSQKKATNNILIIDNTKSMIGFRGSEDIWSDVKAYIIQYVSNQVKIGEVVTIYTFATKLSEPVSFTINSKNDKERVENYINALQAIGLTTCIANALENSIASLDKNQENIIMLFTDGDENCTTDFTTLKKQYNIHKSDIKEIYFIPFNPAVLPYKDVMDIIVGDVRKPIEVPKPKATKKTFNIIKIN
jgi:hypothetical protein